MNGKKWVPEILSALLIFLWVYASFTKLFTYDSFRFQLLGHKLLMNYASTVAWLVPSVEIVIAVALLFPTLRIWGAYASFILLFFFTSYILYMFQFYPQKPCSCGGILNSLGWKEHIIFNLAFMIVAALLIVIYKKREGFWSNKPFDKSNIYTK